jgi:hypothetical protein
MGATVSAAHEIKRKFGFFIIVFKISEVLLKPYVEQPGGLSNIFFISF